MPLATPEQAARAHRLHTWTDAQRQAICSALEDHLRRWSAQWDLSPGVIDVSVLAATPAKTPGAQDNLKALAAALFGRGDAIAGTGERAGLAQRVAEEAWRDWALSTQALLGQDPQVLASTARYETVLEPWSGGVLVSFRWCDVTCVWGLDHRAATAALSLTGATSVASTDSPRACGLNSVMDAMAGTLLPLKVRLASVTLSLGELGALTAGDVVIAPHGLERPLDVCTVDEGLTLCSGWLVQSSGQLALDLVPRCA